MEYKDDFMTCVQKTREEIKEELRDQLFNSAQCIDDDEDENGFQCSQDSSSVFDVVTFARRPGISLPVLCNFTLEELEELLNITNSYGFMIYRGKKSRYSPLTQLFITLCYFCTYQSQEQLCQFLQLRQPGLSKIITKVVNASFPAFKDKFIPKTFTRCDVEFKNFPNAAGAVDTTTVPFYQPSSKEMKKKSWDAKNKVNGIKIQAVVNPRGIAIHINCDHLAAVHDKKIFDVSGATEFLTIKRGVQEIILPILADKGYVGINAKHPTAIVMQKGQDPQVITDNQVIASDRQIVERYWARLKLCWSTASKGFRGEHANLKLILEGLVALTNYLIYLHPMNNEDPFDLEWRNDPNMKPAPSCTPNKDEKDSVVISKFEVPTFALIPMNYAGLVNQGTTCHLNVIIHLYNLIPEITQFFTEASFNSPVLNSFKEIIIKLNETNGATKVVQTKKFLDLFGDKFYPAEDCDTTFNELTHILQSEISNEGMDFDLFDLFRITFQDNGLQNYLSLKSLVGCPSAAAMFKAFARDVADIHVSPYLIIDIQRDPKINPLDQVFKFNTRLKFQYNGEIFNYSLIGIVAYSDFLYIFFADKRKHWVLFDDQNTYQCPASKTFFKALEGGDTDALDITMRTQKKWVAKMLVYHKI